MPKKPSPAKKAPAAPKKKAPAKKISLGAVVPRGSTAATPPAPSLSPAPAASAPTPPAGFVALDRAASSALSKPAPIQVASGPSVAAEVLASATYAQDFSSSAPAAASVAGVLTTAESWTTEEASADAWARYVSTQKQLAWSAALSVSEKLRVEYVHAVLHDATIPSRYPELARFLGAKSAQAAHSAQVAKAAKKKAAKAKVGA